MAPRTDHQPHRRGLQAGHGREVVGVGADVGVVPAAGHRHRDVGMLRPEGGEVVLDTLPVGVQRPARGVVDQRVFQVRRVAQRGLAALPGRGPEQLAQPPQVGPDIGHLRRVAPHLLVVLGVDEQRPEHVLLHRPALAALVVEAVGGHDVGPHRAQRGRGLDRRAHLRHRRVGTAHGPHAPVAPGLRGDPLADVGAVAPGVRRGDVEIDTRGL